MKTKNSSVFYCRLSDELNLYLNFGLKNSGFSKMSEFLEDVFKKKISKDEDFKKYIEKKIDKKNIKLSRGDNDTKF